MGAEHATFVGRRRDLEDLGRAMTGARLLTLTGVGGVGKSRLALEVASRVGDRTRPCAVVELSSCDDAHQLETVVAETLDVARRPPGVHAPPPVVDRIVDKLASDDRVLILDNCEHLAEECATFVDRVLPRCRELLILATSREPLGLPFEDVFHVMPLEVPRPGLPLDAGAALRWDAVRLFADRAAAARPGYALDDRDTNTVVSICRRLDGIPLAIELAAAQVRHLDPVEIADRLDDRLTLLTSPVRTSVARHRTLAAALDWSHDLLGERERAVLRRLAVFVSGTSLAAVEAVCEGGSVDRQAIPVSLTSLADKSLVVRDTDPDGSRYRLLETVRAYALARLRDAGEETATRLAHATYHANANPSAVDSDDVLAALRWSTQEQRADVSLQLAGSAWPVWEARGDLRAGLERIGDALALDGWTDAAARGRALDGAANLALSLGELDTAEALRRENVTLQQRHGDGRDVARAIRSLAPVALLRGDVAGAEQLATRSLEQSRDLGDQHGSAFALATIGLIAQRSGDYARASSLYRQSITLFLSLGLEREAASVLGNLGDAAIDAGDLSRAAECYGEALGIHRRLGDRRGAALTLNNLAIVARERGDFDQAEATCTDAVAEFKALGDRQGVAASLHNLGNLHAELGDPARALALHDESTELYRDLGDRWGVAMALGASADAALAIDDHRRAWQARLGGLLEYQRLGAASQVGEATLVIAAMALRSGQREPAERLCEIGNALRSGAASDTDRLVNEAVTLATSLEHLAPTAADAGELGAETESAHVGGLSAREQEVAGLVATGLPNREIADRLFISERTVESHIAHIRTKLGIESRTQLVRWAIAEGLGAHGLGTPAPSPRR